jgi:hypothetical protein
MKKSKRSTKSKNPTSERRRLVLRREAIAVLSPPQLTEVAGGVGECTYYSGCPPWKNEG